MEYVLTANALSKHYGKFKALNDLSMHVPKGAIYGFVGKNGAGKTTLIRLICGLQMPTEGDYSLYGVDYKDKNIIKARQRMGAVVETPSIYLDMTAEENLKEQYRIVGMPSFDGIPELLKLVGLENAGKKKAANFSLGMKQRLGIAIALAGSPDFIVLDEPTNGLDPVGIHEIRTLIRSLPQKFDCTVLVSSHLLSEIELMADNIGILNHGHLLFEGTLDELKSTAITQGYPTDNLEDTFLAFVDADNRQRGGTK